MELASIKFSAQGGPASGWKETEIGPIPEEWGVVSLGESVKIIDGDRGKNYPSGKDFTSGGYCLFLNTKNVTENGFDFSNLQFISKDKDESMGKGKLKRDDFILTTRGTVGNIAFYDTNVSFENLRINSGMVILRNKGYFDKRYLYQLLKSKLVKNQIVGLTTGSAQPQLPIRDLKNLNLVKPPKPEQTRIAEILSSLDDKIELNRRMNKTLEEMASALFKRWFVDFEFPNENGKPYKSNGGKMVESEMGEVPEGWRVGKMDEILKVSGGTTPDTSSNLYWDNGDIHWATPKDLSGLESLVLLDTGKKITREGLGQIGSGLLPKGTILLSSRAPIGYLAIADMPVAINQGFIAINCDQNLYFYVLIWIKNNIELIKSHANGSTFLEISKGNFKNITAMIPNKEILDKFSDIVKPFYSALINSEKEIANLMQIRDSLLPKLMSGKIRV